jgi:hypothetical protein
MPVASLHTTVKIYTIHAELVSQKHSVGIPKENQVASLVGSNATNSESLHIGKIAVLRFNRITIEWVDST